jgi:hypothetical protein
LIAHAIDWAQTKVRTIDGLQAASRLNGCERSIDLGGILQKSTSI